MPKRDYLDDPDAPRANSIVPAATAFVQDDAGRVLMIRRTDNDLWAIPGGGQDVGETIAQTAVRETREETGIDVEVTGLVGIYTNPRPRHQLRRRRSPPGVLHLLPRPPCRRRAAYEQRVQGSSLGRTRAAGRTEHPPLNPSPHRARLPVRSATLLHLIDVLCSRPRRTDAASHTITRPATSSHTRRSPIHHPRYTSTKPPSLHLYLEHARSAAPRRADRRSS